MEQKQSKINKCVIDVFNQPLCNAYPFNSCKYYKSSSFIDNQTTCIYYYGNKCQCNNHRAITEATPKEKIE